MKKAAVRRSWRPKKRQGFTLVGLVSVMGTIALALAFLQVDAVMTSARRATQAAAFVRARVLAESALVAYPRTGPLSLDVGPARLQLQRAPARAPGTSRAGSRALAHVTISSPDRTATVEIVR